MLNKIYYDTVFTSKIFARIFRLYIGFLNNAAVNLYDLYLDISQVENKNSFSDIFVMFLRYRIKILPF